MNDDDLIESLEETKFSENPHQSESNAIVDSNVPDSPQNHGSSNILDEPKHQETENPESNPVKPPKQDPLKTLLQSLKTFSKEDLVTIRDRTNSLIERRKKAERKAALREAKEMMKKYKFTPKELSE